MQRYLICKKCRNEGFEPTPDVKQPLVNMGGKRYAGPTAIRRYICVQCGHAFETEEVYRGPIKVRVKPTTNQAE